jgi:delta 1-pyrroline-5-carboxylate dehydrogenase
VVTDKQNQEETPTMLNNSIPGLTRGVDSQIPRQVLESRLKTIDKRRAEIEAILNSRGNDESYQAQELVGESAALGAMRAEIDEVLSPRAKPERHPVLQKAYDEDHQRDLNLLRTAIRQQTEQLTYAAEKEEASGNHRQAKILRLQIPELPEQICREYGKSLELLAEIQDD